MTEDGKLHTKTQRRGNTRGDSGDRTQRRRTGHGDAQFAEVDIGTITGAPPVTITITDQDFGRYGGVRTRDAGRRPSRPCSSGDQRDAGYHADRGSGWSKAGLGSGKTAEGKGKALDAPMAQKKTDDAMAETCEANDGVELARKKGGPKTGLPTNMEMLLNNLTLPCLRCGARQWRWWWRKSRKKSAAQ